MDGFLDYLAPAHALHAKRWKRRFVRLDAAFHALEVFRDDAMLERKCRIRLDGAQVATADELGGLLFAGDGEQRRAQLSAKIPIENSRRFVLRVSEFDAAKTRPRHHFLCAEVVDAAGAVNAHASRSYMQQWLQTLQRVARASALHSDEDPARAPLDSRELTARIAAYMDRMHLSAHVTGREVAGKKSLFEVTVKAWILRRELVAADDGDDDDDGSKGRADASCWQILEYACAWKVLKTSAQLRDFDAQLRQFFQQELRDVAPVPSGSSLSPSGAIQHLLHSASHMEAESQRRVTATDAYLQQLLCLPAFSAFGSDGSAMLDNFLDITPHFASFRQIEKESGQSMHLRKRKVVPWHERETFERLYKLHLDAVRTKLEAADRHTAVSVTHRSRDADKSDARRTGSKQQQHQRHDHPHHSRKIHANDSQSGDAAAEVGDEPAAPVALESIRAASVVEGTSESVHERIAKIGKKLISEAFTAPPLHSEPHTRITTQR